MTQRTRDSHRKDKFFIANISLFSNKHDWHERRESIIMIIVAVMVNVVAGDCLAREQDLRFCVSCS
jgi:hypothetical protein